MPDDRDELRPEEVQQVLRRLDKQRGYRPLDRTEEPSDPPAGRSGAAPVPADGEAARGLDGS
jgi:hypothetical protein